MNPAVILGIVGGILITLILLGSAAWLGSGIGRTLERESVRRDIRSVEAFNLVSQALANLGNRDADETLGLLLKKTGEGLRAKAGCILFSTEAGQPLRLVYSLGVTNFAAILQAANDPLFLSKLKASPDNIIADFLVSFPAWAPMGERGGKAFATTLFGRERGWHGLLILSWATPEEATELVPSMLNIGRYAGQVLAELESRDQRARDFLSLSTQLNAQESRIKQIDSILHDAQNPLAQIPGILFLLEEQSNGNKVLPPKAVAEVEGLVILAAGILKTEIMHRQLDVEAVPITQLIELLPSMVSGTFTDRLGDHNVRFEMDVPSGLPSVCGERVSLIRVLNNLLNNAAKYNVQDGYIRLQARQSGEQIVFDIENSGPSIPGSVLPRLFDFGYRVEGSDQLAHGHGIGLYSCKKIVDQHGGKIWAESKDGINHFIFTVPIVTPEK